MEENNKRRLLVCLIGLLAAIVTAVVVFKISSNPNINKDAINTNINDSWRHKKGTNDSTKVKKLSTDDEIEDLFADIEKARNATDGWPGMQYGLLLNIKKLDMMGHELNPEQVERLEMYKQEYPDWESVDE